MRKCRIKCWLEDDADQQFAAAAFNNGTDRMAQITVHPLPRSVLLALTTTTTTDEANATAKIPAATKSPAFATKRQPPRIFAAPWNFYALQFDVPIPQIFRSSATLRPALSGSPLSNLLKSH